MDVPTLVVLAGLVLAYAALSRRLDGLLVSAAMFFVTSGFVLGPSGLGWIDLTVGNSTVRLLAEATLTLVLFADAARIELAVLRREFTMPARLLGVGLPLTIVAGVVVALATVAGLSPVEALVLAIVLAPTDAALGQAVVIDRRLPSRIRQSLNVESGLNDGICVPLLLIAIALAEAEEGVIGGGAAVTLVIEEIGFGIVGGALAGGLGALVLIVAVRRALSTVAWLQVIPPAAAAMAYGIADSLGGSGFIAAFVGGLVFGSLRRDAGGEATTLTEEIGAILNALTFIVFGAAFLGPVLAGLTPPLALYAVLSLTAIRMVPVAAALLGSGAKAPSVAFIGWFGPRGLASIVFAVIVVEEAALPHAPDIMAAIAATVLLSILAHGLSARPLTERYVRWWSGHAERVAEPMEGKAVPDLAVRWQRFRSDAS